MAGYAATALPVWAAPGAVSREPYPPDAFAPPLAATPRLGWPGVFTGAGACVLGLLMFRAVALGLLAPPHPQPDHGARQPLLVLQPEPSRITGATNKLQANARRQAAVTIFAASFPRTGNILRQLSTAKISHR